ncbi:radical SAM protein [Acidaminococcus fermentans]|uniref:radical SAM protein n=1 Tax=Acidaminococcus fermentans TaxID=905 RepID=UPI003077964B
MKSVTIYLGSRCNMNCAYCHREADPEETKGLPPEFYERLKTMAREGALTVKFMGGEPTLYMDTIKKVVAAVPGATFAIATNGKHLETFLPFFRAHHFKIALSYDGGDVDLRGFNPLEKLVDYPYLSISTTIFHGNTDFRKILAQFREKREKGMKISFFPHLVHHTSPVNAAYALTKEDYASVLRQWKELVLDLVEGFKETGHRTGLSVPS